MPDFLAYAMLFTAVGTFFIFSHLLIGKLVRPNRPDAEKKTIYECGEPTIGSSWIQFDLRFYVVALLFVIFDVEMAFFFPWAVVFSKANALADHTIPVDQRRDMVYDAYPAAKARKMELTARHGALTGEVEVLKREVENATNDTERAIRRQQLSDKMAALGDAHTRLLKLEQEATGVTMMGPRRGVVTEDPANAARTFAWVAFADILVFFGVLLVGFAYLWRRGDLDWVRSVAGQKSTEPAGV